MPLTITHAQGMQLMEGMPLGYPKHHPVAGEYRVPVLPRVGIEVMPKSLIAFNDLNRCQQPSDSAIHFFKDDYKFYGVMLQPYQYLARFSTFGSILTPDRSITSGMSDHERRTNVVASRAVGACYADKGISVITTVRWDSERDYELVSSGIPSHSVYAVSTVGVVKDKARRHEFTKGFDYLFKTLKPEGIVVYGTRLPELDFYMGRGVAIDFHPFNLGFASEAKPKENSDNPGLF